MTDGILSISKNRELALDASSLFFDIATTYKLVINLGEKRGPTRDGYGTRRLPAEHLSLRGECSVDSSLFHARSSMVRQRAYPRSFGSPVSLVSTGQLIH
jgi:hypothetical protein